MDLPLRTPRGHRRSRSLHGAPRGLHCAPGGLGDPGGLGGGFTLIELVLVLTLLVLVLSTTYRMVVDALDAERRLETITLPEKVGEGLLTNFRRDLQGVFFRNMGRRVFLVTDGGTGDQSRDELRFLSTVEPTPVQDPDNAYSSFQTIKLHTLTGINYFLRKTSRNDGLDAYTLFRKEIVDFDPIEPLQGRGVAYELYDKVAYLSIECFDGWSWYTDWSSEIRIETEEADLLAMQEGETGVARVTQPRASASALAAAPGVDPATGAPAEILPPSAVPVAIRIELGIYVSTAGRVLRDVEGNPVLKRYATVVQIPSSQRIPLPDAAAGLSADGSTVAGGEGADGAAPVTQVRGQNVMPGQDARGGGGRGGGGARGFGGGGGRGEGRAGALGGRGGGRGGGGAGGAGARFGGGGGGGGGGRR